MLNAKFDISPRSLGKLLEQLDNDKLKKKIQKLKGGGEWLDKLSDKELVQAAVAADKAGVELLQLGFSDKGGLMFPYGDATKKLFLLHLEEQGRAAIGIHNAVNTFMSVEKIEQKFEKCVLNFTNDEIEKTFVVLYEEMKYHRLRSGLYLIVQYQDFVGGTESNWKEYASTKKVNEALAKLSVKREDKLTLQSLITLFKNSNNPQNAIVPMLIFQGVGLSKVEDMDELRYLKKDDLRGNTLFIGGNGNGTVKEREIELDESIARMVEEAINQSYIIRVVNHTPVIESILDTPYVLRPVENRRKRKDKPEDEVMSFRGINTRISSCKQQIELETYHSAFSSKVIETSGKHYFMGRFVASGLDEREAAKKVLKRFGDWREEKGNEEHNRQSIRRLIQTWKASVNRAVI